MKKVFMYITVVLTIFMGINSVYADECSDLSELDCNSPFNNCSWEGTGCKTVDAYGCYYCISVSLNDSTGYKWATSSPNSACAFQPNIKSESDCSGTSLKKEPTKCGDYGTITDCNSSTLRCKWNYSGNYCENVTSTTANKKCGDIGTISDCNSSEFNCKWNYSGSYCEPISNYSNVSDSSNNSNSSNSSDDYGLKYVSCGNSTDIPAGIPKITSNVINAIKIFVPIILIVFGMIDFVRAMIAQEEKQMIDARQKFVRRTISAVVVFLVIVIVQICFRLLDNLDNVGGNIASCMNCFINYKCEKGVLDQDSDNKVDYTLSCNDYTSSGTCPKVDQKGNLCSWNKSTNKCINTGTAAECEDFTSSSSCKNDDYGYSCKWDSNISKCLRGDKTGKYCANYDYANCPEEDDYGYNCAKTYSGGRPVCMASDRNNVIE